MKQNTCGVREKYDNNVVGTNLIRNSLLGLLHPSLLSGEGGYYLTTLSSAVHVLKNFKENKEDNIKNMKTDVSNEKMYF